MNQKIKARATAIVQQKRRNAESEYNRKKQPLLQNEEYAFLDQERTKLSISLARAEAYGDKEKIEENHEKLKKIEEKCQKIEEKYQFFEKEPNFSCKLCKDNGYVDGQMCQCLKREISNLLLQESGFEKLADFQSSMATAGDLAPVYRLMQKWCNSEFNKDLVLIAGQPGVGKTHLTRCMANELIQKGKVVKITTSFNMNLKFREYVKTRNEEILSEFLSPEFLFIDDLGAEPIYNNVTEQYTYLVINERKMRKFPTVITSNLTLADLQEHYDERVFARIADRMTSINIFVEGPDRRISK